MSAKLQEALAKLDVGNDNHWTADGLPRLDTVRFMTGDQSVTRESINQVAPGFSRASAAVTTAAPVQPEVTLVAPVGGVVAAEGTGIGIPVAQLAAPEGEADGEVASLAQEIADGEEYLNQLRSARGELDKRFKEATEQLEKLKDRMTVLVPLETTSTTIQGYLQRQQQVLAERAARKQVLKDSGVNFRDLLGSLQAPIDAAMARKNNRGTGRPGR